MEENVSIDKYSVLMSVYYKERPDHLYQAMDSIFRQTFASDDFVLVCDGPLTDELDEVIRGFETAHPELNVVRLTKNCGLGNALNFGLQHCKHELIARMDSDDISCTDRCEKQIRLFNEHPNISICSGTVIEFTHNEDNVIGKRIVPLTNAEIVAYSKKRNPFNHPAVMVKKQAVADAGGYNERFPLFEDYYLWIRMLMNGAEAMNIIDPLVVFCKCKFPKVADKNGESCISVLEKVAGCPAGLPRRCRSSTADILLN